MTVAMVASEMFPYVKSGGLADAVGGLCRELSRHEETIAILPLYRSIDCERFDIHPAGIDFSLNLGGEKFNIKVYKCFDDGCETYFIHHPALCDHEQLYDCPDNDLRFGIFAHAVCELAANHINIDILHLHDWQSALAAPLAKEPYRLRCRVVLTIHNLAFQGIFSKEAIERLNLGWDRFTIDRLEFYDKVNFLKGGIADADAVTTVSQTYAQEIKHPDFGWDMDRFLRTHEDKLSGILNGIEASEFDPASDRALSFPFDNRHIGRKQEEKHVLCAHIGLHNSHYPLFAYVGRLAEQKGIKDLAEMLRSIADVPINVVILGSGDPYHEALCKPLEGRENIRVILGYDEALSRRIYAASDFFLMPSKFEPCGLAQMIAMRYGSIPIVRKTGGLRDTVIDFTDSSPHHPNPSAGMGITMERTDIVSFMHAIIKALALYADREKHASLIVSNMKKDFSWRRPVMEYLKLYRALKPF